MTPCPSFIPRVVPSTRPATGEPTEEPTEAPTEKPDTGGTMLVMPVLLMMLSILGIALITRRKLLA